MRVLERPQLVSKQTNSCVRLKNFPSLQEILFITSVCFAFLLQQYSRVCFLIFCYTPGMVYSIRRDGAFRAPTCPRGFVSTSDAANVRAYDDGSTGATERICTNLPLRSFSLNQSDFQNCSYMPSR